MIFFKLALPKTAVSLSFHTSRRLTTTTFPLSASRLSLSKVEGYSPRSFTSCRLFQKFSCVRRQLSTIAMGEETEKSSDKTYKLPPDYLSEMTGEKYSFKFDCYYFDDVYQFC